MNAMTLPGWATTEETSLWLSDKTGKPWNLSSLLASGLTPHVWLDYSEEYADLFAEGIKRYPAPIFFVDDIKRLSEGSPDVLIRMTRDSDRISFKLTPPGISMPLDAIRFFQLDIVRMAEDILHPPVQAPAPAKEIPKGMSKEEIIFVFGSMVKMDLGKSLADAIGIFGDDGARVRKNSRAGKNSYLWNPVTLALGLNDVYRVPMPRLKKAFAVQSELAPWKDAWLESLRLLGE
ncbi:hypothetical protein [Duganella hordei]|uniref:hypothetical protein n=1 Tax=Duganella hordei TaxID=2865934 RepID=UPI0030E9D9C8